MTQRPPVTILIVPFLIAALLSSGCANTIPSRAGGALPVYPTAYYPVKVFVYPFADKRPHEETKSPRTTSWPGSRGRIDYYGENVSSGLSEAVSEYLSASRVFLQTDMADFIAPEEVLKQKGYRALMTAEIRTFNAGFSVPKWILLFTVIPNPLFFILPGITLLPIIVWPKEMDFNVVLDEIKLKDLETGKIVWSGKAEIRRTSKRATRHITSQWFLGEGGELISKELVRQLVEARIKELK